MTLPMARDLGKFGIRVVTLAPGVFVTPMGKSITPKYLEGLTRETAIGRLGTSPEFADAVSAIV
jgi:NAD(P)-dependent dehydrogenase (short-subunit alcohol dehydrogenase family)